MKWLALIFTSSIFVSSSAFADGKPETGLVTIKANCTTDSTGGDGKRKACDSPWQVFQTTAGFVIAEHSLQVREISANGSEHQCLHVYDKYVEVIPGTGITAPTFIALRAHARSPKGHWSGRGWEYCEANFVQAAIHKLTAEDEKLVKMNPPVAREDEGHGIPEGDPTETAQFLFEPSATPAP